MNRSTNTYDLFLSHRGPDTEGFCSFLKEALDRAGVHTVVDKHDHVAGDFGWTTMQNMLRGARFMLRGARFVMPVISEGFLESQQCLDELALMMQSPANVMPVLFGVTLVDLLPR